MRSLLLLFLPILLFGRSIPEGYISPIPADVLTKKEVKVHFGLLHFNDGTPTPKTKEKIKNELAYMQLSSIYFHNHEAVWLEILKEELEKLGITPNKTLGITASPITSKMLWPRLDPATIYTVAILDLHNTPLILQMPEGFDKALLLDHYGNEVVSLDANGTYLLYSPDENFVPKTKMIRIDDEDKELRTLQSDTYTNFLFIQMPRDQNVTAFESQLHITALQNDTNKTNSFLDISSMQSIALLPKSARFFKLLDNIAQDDTLPADKAKELARAGIVKDRAFQPDLQQRLLLQDAAHSAGLILQNTSSLSHLKALDCHDKNATAIILTHDDANATLVGSNHYVVHISAISAQSWSVTLYDTQTASMLQNPLQLRPYILSTDKNLLYNEDGSIDLHFTPQIQNDAQSANTIKTVAGKNFFVMIRFYKPQTDHFDLSLQKIDDNASKTEPDEDISVF